MTKRRKNISAIPHLKHGEFLGNPGHAVHAGGFSFREVAHAAAVTIPRHTHDDAHFVLVLAGEYCTEARCGRRPLSSPSLIFNPPGTTHRDHFTSHSGRFFTISVLPTQFERLSGIGLGVEYAMGFAAGEKPALARRILHEVRRGDVLCDIVLEGLGLELLAHTVRSTQKMRRSSPPPWLARAVDLLRSSQSSPITVREVAAEVGVHPYHLARVTRAFLGQSPGELLRGFRLETARQLLTRTSRSLSDIALNCGYSDQSQFTRSFTRSHGIPPGAYRRAVK